MLDIIDHYDQVREETRLEQGWGALELARTQELILRHLAKPPGTVLDVGGAAGVYSSWLGSLGYETHLVDAVPRHVEQAGKRLDTIKSAEVGDARQLAWKDESFDVVLLFDPLYHLTERSERAAALREAWRALRPNGVLFGAAICRFAPLLDSLVRGFVDDPRFAPILDQDLNTGQHRNPTGDPNFFTTAFLHLPDELRSEVAAADFSVIDLVGIEGPAWLAADFEARWADAARRARLLELTRSVELEPTLFGLSHHLLVVARKAD